MKKPFLIIIDGPIGSGKTTVSQLLHKKLKKTALICLDKIKRLVSDYKPKYEYHNLASEIGKKMTKEYLRRGWNVIVEKAFTKEEFINEYLKFRKNNKIKIFVFQIKTTLDIAIKRVRKREKFKKTNMKLSLNRIKRNHKHYERYGYRKAKIFDSTKLKPEIIVKEILKELR